MKKLLLLILAIGFGFTASAQTKTDPCVMYSYDYTFYNGGMIRVPAIDIIPDVNEPIILNFSYVVTSGNMRLEQSPGKNIILIYGSGDVEFQITFYNPSNSQCPILIDNYKGRILPSPNGGGGGNPGGGGGDHPKDLEVDGPTHLTTP